MPALLKQLNQFNESYSTAQRHFHQHSYPRALRPGWPTPCTSGEHGIRAGCGRKWSKLANLLRRDYNNVNTYYPLPKDKEKADLLRKVILSCQKMFFDLIVDEWDEGDVSASIYKVKDDIMAEDIKIQAAKQKALEEEQNAAELQKLILASTDEEPLTEAQMEEAAQKDYQALADAEKEYVDKAKKQKMEEIAKETARKEAAKAKILEAKARLEKARPKKSNS
jgi:hypothetical protein